MPGPSPRKSRAAAATEAGESLCACGRCVQGVLLSYLHPGQAFRGTQTVVSNTVPQTWAVRVVGEIEYVDICAGKISGTMEAMDVPATTQQHVLTHWEGEIVNGITSTFATRKWGSTYQSDLDHWGKFPSFTEELARLAAFPNTPMVKGSKAAMEECHEARRQLSDYLARSRVLYMRWKETNFINLTSDCGLTIDGFYYIVFDRASGIIDGFYADPHSNPFQRLQLMPVMASPRSGHFMPSYTIVNVLRRLPHGTTTSAVCTAGDYRSLQGLNVSHRSSATRKNIFAWRGISCRDLTASGRNGR